MPVVKGAIGDGQRRLRLEGGITVDWISITSGSGVSGAGIVSYTVWLRQECSGAISISRGGSLSA